MRGYENKTEMVRIAVRVPKILNKKVNGMVDTRCFRDKSALLREALRRGVLSIEVNGCDCIYFKRNLAEDDDEMLGDDKNSE